MNTLYVIRHAKSSWDESDQSDFERSLNDRGKRDAPRMGKRLKERGIHADLMLSSPAQRAYSTAKRIADVMGYSKKNITTDKQIYHASEDGLLDAVQSINDNHTCVFLFGHNPGLTDFVNSLADENPHIDNVPTCGIVGFKLNVSSWKDVQWRSAKMLFFDYPKALK